LNLLTDWHYRLPNKESFLVSIKNKLDQIEKEKKSNSDLNKLDLTKINKPLSLIKVAVWDTGVDEKVIKNVSNDTALFYDKNGESTKEKMMPLIDINEKEWYLFKGFLEMSIATKSEASIDLLKNLSEFTKEEMTRFRAIIYQLRLYSHGTSVASVVSKGNPKIEIIPIRITFDSDPSEFKIFTPARVENELKMHETISNLIKKNNIAVVNMSWNHRLKDIEATLMNITTLNKEQITELAKVLFIKLKESLYNLMKDCSDTLFVGGAGNENINIETDGNIPSSLQLPNLITVGAVNENGTRTDFTTIGKNVQLYANGSYVNTILPRGYNSKSSGTSIAAPQVSNLAATMLSICPRLKPITIKKMLLENADKMLSERILVLNPKKTIQETIKLN